MLNTKENQRKAFLSPDGTQFFGRRAAIDHMIQNRHSQDDITLMRENLTENGWYKDTDLLPDGWMVIDSMAKKYMDADAYPFHQPGDERVVMVVDITSTSQMG